jgi:hypothetical protein
MNTSNIDYLKKGKTKLDALLYKQIIEEELKKKHNKELKEYIRRKQK